MRKGLEVFGLATILKEFPILHYFFHPNNGTKLNVMKLKHLLPPKFSEEGSNALLKEKEVYALFIKYMREVASGWRTSGSHGITLSCLLEFVTGGSEEPVLGFSVIPSIEFVIPIDFRNKPSFVPTSNT